MKFRGLGLLLVALWLSVAAADDTKVGKGFWKILVKPKATWVLRNSAT